MKGIEIVAIGNEILTGRTLDTNSNWLARRITVLGGKITRMVAVGDEVEAIVEEINCSMEHGAEVVITSGGMGPTLDDKTLEAVAQATGKELALDPKALDFVTHKYREFKQKGFVESEEMTPSRRKMAIVPEGATLLPNPVGAAPGVMLRFRKTTFICLPGVPAELKAIFEEHLVEWFKSLFGGRIYREREVITDLGDESKLAEIIGQVMKWVDNVYLKSKPKHFGKDVHLGVCITASGKSEREVHERIDLAIEELKNWVEILEG